MATELQLQIPVDVIKVTDGEGNQVPLRELTLEQVEELAGGFLRVLLYQRERERMH